MVARCRPTVLPKEELGRREAYRGGVRDFGACACVDVGSHSQRTHHNIT